MRKGRRIRKLAGPAIVGKLKYVRIDERTTIQVDASISDEDAKSRYLLRHAPIERKHIKAVDPIPVEEEELLPDEIEEIVDAENSDDEEE